MILANRLKAAGVALLLAAPAAAQDATDPTTMSEVRAEIAEAVDSIAAYSAQERDAALTEARAVLKRLDTEIERREQVLRENWAEMSGTARATAEDRLRDLRQARNTLGERYGALESGVNSAWDELKIGFSGAWTAFSDAWRAADEDMPAD